MRHAWTAGGGAFVVVIGILTLLATDSISTLFTKRQAVSTAVGGVVKILPNSTQRTISVDVEVVLAAPTTSLEIIALIAVGNAFKANRTVKGTGVGCTARKTVTVIAPITVGSAWEASRGAGFVVVAYSALLANTSWGLPC